MGKILLRLELFYWIFKLQEVKKAGEITCNYPQALWQLFPPLFCSRYWISPIASKVIKNSPEIKWSLNFALGVHFDFLFISKHTKISKREILEIALKKVNGWGENRIHLCRMSLSAVMPHLTSYESIRQHDKGKKNDTVRVLPKGTRKSAKFRIQRMA